MSETKQTGQEMQGVGHQVKRVLVFLGLLLLGCLILSLIHI